MIPVTMNSPPHVAAGSVTARMRRMLGRNPREHGRAATPLELLFDLTFVVAFGIAGSQMAHEIAEGRLAVGLGGFAFGMFAIIWAWINFSWFASAFDTDDWVYRLTTMVQMAGVLVLALGLSDVFHSLEGGHGIDNTVVVAGYVIMRVAMLAQWLRLAAQSPAHRRTALIYATFIAIAQIGWVATAVPHLELGPPWRSRPCSTSSSSGVRCSPSGGIRPPGIRTTSRSATACSCSSPSAKACSAR